MTAATHVVGGGPIRLRFALSWYAGRALRVGLWVLVVVLVAAVIAPIALVATDRRPMVVDTSAMQPTVASGDIIVNEVVPAGSIQVGDVVTYADSWRGGGLLTERVVDVQHEGLLYTFTTKADARPGAATFVLDDQSSVGRMAYRVPAVGGVLAMGATRLVLMVGAVVLVVGVLPRRWWSLRTAAYR